MCKLKATDFSQVGAAQNPPWKSKRCRYPCVFQKYFFRFSSHTQKMLEEEEQSLTQLGVISILMRFLNGLFCPFWWLVMKCFEKFNSILRRVHPHPEGNPKTKHCQLHLKITPHEIECKKLCYMLR